MRGTNAHWPATSSRSITMVSSP
ncbi:MAG: hypothetical protein K0Q71_2714, partial [Thermomicrobiales bacterium]|nr:hypothetical protein [Thermomicrobiales bacterium]